MMLTNNQLIAALRNNVAELNSPKVQLKIEQQANELEKQEFLKERQKVRNYLHILGRQELANIVAKMKPLEPELNQAITDLDRELKNINSTVKIISSIRMVTKVLAKFVTIL